MFPQDLIDAAAALIADCRARNLTVSTAESCTGGLIAALLTDIPGSSAVFDRGFVTYSNDAKHALLGVPQPLLAEHGAVSRETARAMARGTIDRSHAAFAVSVTGIAGPTGDSPGKPIGLVHFGCAGRGAFESLVERRFDPSWSRQAIRLASVGQALALLRTAVAES